MSNSEGPFFTPQFKLDPGLAKEHCKAKLKQIQDIWQPSPNDGSFCNNVVDLTDK